MFIYKNLVNILKSNIFQFIGITLLVSFLLFLLNMFLAISYNISNFSNDLNHKLGIYFYIKDDAGKKDQIYSETISLIKKLENDGLKVEYYSKDDALKLLEKRMPDVIKNFKKYGIENPLPPTIYVIFDTKEKYEKLQTTISGYSHIIMNIDDVALGKTFTQQENRIVNVINLTNVLVIFAYFLIVVLVVIIMTFLLFVIKNNFNIFYKQIEVEKLIGAFYRQIKSPFIIKVLIILLLAFGLMVFYFVLLIGSISGYFMQAFDLNISGYVLEKQNLISKVLLVEFVTIIVISFVISNFFLNRLIKKV